jgi:SAM-dependent methyltransferase
VIADAESRSAGAARENLIAQGRRTRVPLGFARERDRVYLIARERAAEWPIDLLRTGRVRLAMPTETREGAVALVVDEGERKRALEIFRSKYGSALFARWYENPARVLRVSLDSGTAAAAGPEHYYEWLRAEFDNVAEEYDRHIAGNRMNRLLRDRSLAFLRPTFARSRYLLEVGCGSGMETIPLLRDGHEILAVDVSEKMLEVVRRKASSEGRSEQLRTRRLRAADLGQLAEDDAVRGLEGAYSTYGALNCEPDLDPVASAFANLLPPSASLVLGIYNRWCLFELVGYGMTGQTGRAFGRRRNPVPVGTSRFCIDVFAYSPSDIRDRFAPEFRMREVEGVPVLLPPSDLTSYAERYARHFESLAALDAWAGRRFPLSRLGDHFLVRLVRSSSPALHGARGAGINGRPGHR